MLDKYDGLAFFFYLQYLGILGLKILSDSLKLLGPCRTITCEKGLMFVIKV